MQITKNSFMKHVMHFHSSDKNNNHNIITNVIGVVEGVDENIINGSTKLLRKHIADGLKQKGWTSKVKLSIHSNISITAINGKTALCLQTGNMGRFYSDLLKLQYLYQKQKIESSIYILPTTNLAKKLGSNLANYERLVTELNLFCDVITVPIAVIGLR